MGSKTTSWRCGVLVFLAAAIAGCGRSGGTVEETDRFSFDDMAAQLAAEEAASSAERED